MGTRGEAAVDEADGVTTERPESSKARPYPPAESECETVLDGCNTGDKSTMARKYRACSWADDMSEVSPSVHSKIAINHFLMKSFYCLTFKIISKQSSQGMQHFRNFTIETCLKTNDNSNNEV